jgi:two-component system phosphoglycerate transport system response regulator PgtA
MKLILIEDNADLAWTMRSLLELRGYEVRCYLSAQECLQQAASLTDDDVLITDYYLPDLNGIELLKRVRAKRPRVKAILLTGSREDGIVRAAEEIRDCRVEFKPLDYESLDRRIREVRSA